MKLVLTVIAAAMLMSSSVAAQQAPHVVATIKPIHSLVAAVMGDLGQPELIVRGGSSAHTYSLRPSDAAALENADVVFWTGRGMELFLEEALETLAVDATVVELSASTGVVLLPVREGGAFEAHEHEHDDHGHDHDEPAHDPAGGVDMHYWLDPVHGARVVEAIADALAAVDPDNAATYAANASAEIERLRGLTADIEAQLASVRGTPFVVFHDALQYFENRFGLSVAGTITVTPDTMPGAARVAEIRERIGKVGAACVFAEPQFEPAIVETIVEGTGARIGTLDPEAAGFEEGPELYRELIRSLAAALVDCLGG